MPNGHAHDPSSREASGSCRDDSAEGARTGAGIAVAESPRTVRDAGKRSGKAIGDHEDPAAPAHPAAARDSLDYGAMYAAAYESNIRVRHWLCDIYDLHALPQNPQLHDTPHRSALHSPTLRTLRLLLSVRHLVLELWNFQTIYTHYSQMKKDLDVGKASDLSLIIKDHKVVGSLKRLRNDLAHQAMALGDLAEEIESLGLGSFVHYARAVLMFEDAVYRTVSNNRHKPKNANWDLSKLTFELPGSLDRDAFAKKYSNVNFPLDPERNYRECVLMGELRLSLLMLYTSFVESAQNASDHTLDSHLRFTSHVYNSKYMIMDMHSFIAKFIKLGLQKAVTPDFLARERLYNSLRHDHFAHTKITKIQTIESLLATHPDLFSHMLLDILEIDAITSRLLERFETPSLREIPLMSREQIDKIDKEMKAVQLESHGRLGRSYMDPHEEKKRLEARAIAKRRLGLR